MRWNSGSIFNAASAMVLSNFEGFRRLKVFGKVTPDIAAQGAFVFPVPFVDVERVYPQNLVHLCVHQLVLVRPYRSAAQVEGIENVFRQSDPGDLVNNADDIAVVRRVSKRPDGPLLLGCWYVG